MLAARPVLRRGERGWWHWCPACGEEHPLPDGWRFNGDLVRPSFESSFQHSFGAPKDTGAGRRPRMASCHYLITDGKIQYCAGSWHGRTDAAALPPLPVFPPPPSEDRMPKPLVILVGADKGGVGKTQTCRALRDYMDTPARMALPRPRLFDGQHPRGELVNFRPEAQVVNITDVADQMKIFDTLEGVTMVDIPAGQLGETLRVCDSARLLDDVRSGDLRMALLHVLGPSVSSLDEIGDAVAMLGASAKHFIVKNHINETKFFEWDANSSYARSLRALADVTIEIPHLETLPNEAVQAAGISFVGFIGGNAGRVQRGLVATWLKKTWEGFDKVGIGRMIDETFAV